MMPLFGEQGMGEKGGNGLNPKELQAPPAVLEPTLMESSYGVRKLQGVPK